MNYLDLFHGIGGFAYGAYLAGMKFENHLCSDIEPYCQKLYKLRFPDSIQLGNITKIDTQELINKYGTEWIITGGFPCQDISIAGKGEGITGSRSGLWFEYWRIIRDLRPRFAIMENVAALTFRGLAAVLGSLSEIGYNAEWQHIRASDMGAPHKRERIWIVAYSERVRRRGWNNGNEGKLFRALQIEGSGSANEQEILADCESLRWNSQTFKKMDAETSEREQGCGFDNGGQDVADTSESGLQERTGKESKPSRISKQSERYCKMPDSFSNELQRGSKEQIQGERDIQGQSGRVGERESNRWSVEPDVGRLAHGIPHRVDRLKGLGNAIVPQIAELLFRQIKSLVYQ
ncbi:MAG: DNA cytosine methyltransferase [Spirochaetes bacterium]|nr:DNA cytosine methyltransferase [Spirochaetota bacterium]